MFDRPRAVTMLALAGLVILPAMPVAGQAAAPDPLRFEGQIGTFLAYDAQNSSPRDAVLFVGSSSIVRWSTAEDFPDLTVINRGFGGSHVSDVNHYVEETVLRHAPALVVFYAGNNDIAAGKTAQQVFADYEGFVAKIGGQLGGTDILFISIHPSLLRWERWPEMQEANRLIRELSASNPRLHYADIASAMLGGDGTPIPELFVADGLHLTRAGYDVWTPIVSEAIAAVQR